MNRVKPIQETTKFPNIINELRVHNESQEELADIIGITRQNLRRKLIGESSFRLWEILIICEHYNKEFNELFKGE